MRRLLATIIGLSFFAVAPQASAQEVCTEAVMTQIFSCSENDDTLMNCLAPYPQCDIQDLNDQTTANVIGSKIFTACCAKSTKNQILSCLTVAKNSFKTPAVKNLIPSAVLKELRGNLADVVNNVKANGSCANP